MNGPIQTLPHTDKSAAVLIRGLLQEAYRAEAELLGVTDFPPLRRTLADITASANSFYGIRAREALAGLVELEVQPGKPGILIASLAVSAAHRRRGIATALVRFSIELAGGEIRVSTGENNEPAIGLYRQLGFIEASRSATAEGIRRVHLVCNRG